MDGEGRPSCTVTFADEEVALRLKVPGVHNVWNACAALAVGLQFDVDLKEGAKALEQLTLLAMRLEVRRSPLGVVVVDDSYNASPASMKGALDTLALSLIHIWHQRQDHHNLSREIHSGAGRL